jgi:hypothetical protein
MRLQSQWEFRPRWVASLERRLLGLSNPIDLLRRRLTRGLEVSARDQQVRRGEEVEALVTTFSAQGLGEIEVGIVCTEYYARYTEGIGTGDSGSGAPSDPLQSGGRATTYAIAHEAWLPVESAAGKQSIRLTIPPGAPFSYEGDCISFRWELVARGRRRRRLDALAKRDISVLP